MWKKLRHDRRTKQCFKLLRFIQPYCLIHFFWIPSWQSQLQYFMVYVGGSYRGKGLGYVLGNLVSPRFILSFWASLARQTIWSFQHILGESTHQGSPKWPWHCLQPRGSIQNNSCPCHLVGLQDGSDTGLLFKAWPEKDNVNLWRGLE